MTIQPTLGKPDQALVQRTYTPAVPHPPPHPSTVNQARVNEQSLTYLAFEFYGDFPEKSSLSDLWISFRDRPRTTDPNLFRPISLTSVICKVIESIFKEKMLAHLSQFSLLASRQHGFLPRQSTLTSLLVAEELITKWLYEESIVDLIYQYFFKTFD